MTASSTVFAFHSAKRAEVEREKEFTSTHGALRRRQGFKRNHALNFLQTRDPQMQFLQSVFLEAPHPIGSSCVPEKIGLEAATQDRANGFVDLE